MWFYVLLVVAFCDIYWILRLAFTRLISFVLPRTSLLGDGGTIFSICWTNDLDIFAHMNNAKYYKEMDFGRFDFYFRSGLEEYITARSWPIVQHACSMRYRRPINFLVPFKLVTKLRYWNERSLFFEQKFVSLHDGFVRAIGTSMNTVVGGDVLQMMDQFGHPQPQCPPDIQMWLDSMEITSSSLREHKPNLNPVKLNGENGVEAKDKEL